jgi:hypothetical protein
MAIDVDFWSNGADPFDIPWGDFVLHIHAGAKPGSAATTPKPATGTTPATGPVLSLPAKPNVPPPLMLRELGDVGEIARWLDASGDGPVTLRLDTTSDTEGFNLQTVLDGLAEHGDRIVKLDVVGWASHHHG